MQPLDFLLYILKVDSYDNFMQVIHAYKNNDLMIINDKLKSILYGRIKHIVYYYDEIIIVNGDIDSFVEGVIREYKKYGRRQQC